MFFFQGYRVAFDVRALFTNQAARFDDFERAVAPILDGPPLANICVNQNGSFRVTGFGWAKRVEAERRTFELMALIEVGTSAEALVQAIAAALEPVGWGVLGVGAVSAEDIADGREGLPRQREPQ